MVREKTTDIPSKNDSNDSQDILQSDSNNKTRLDYDKSTDDDSPFSYKDEKCNKMEILNNSDHDINTDDSMSEKMEVCETNSSGIFNNENCDNNGQQKSNEIKNINNLMPEDIQHIVLGVTGVTVRQCAEINLCFDNSNLEENSVADDLICEDVDCDTESETTADNLPIISTFDEDYYSKSNSNNFINGSLDKLFECKEDNEYGSEKNVHKFSYDDMSEIITISKVSDEENSNDSRFDYENETDMSHEPNINDVLGFNDYNCSIKISNSSDSEDNDNVLSVSINYDHEIDAQSKNLIKKNIDMIESSVTTNDDLKVNLNDKYLSISDNSSLKVSSYDFKDGEDDKSTLIKDSLVKISLNDKLDNYKNVIESKSLEGSSGTINSDKNLSNCVSLEEFSANLANEECDNNKQADSTVLQNDSNMDDIKNESDAKISSFRNRSGSSDNTGSGSESGSNCSGRRRSDRIKTNVVEKQGRKFTRFDRSRESSPVLLAPPVPEFESDKPVKVKSRWTRTSELEMGSQTSSEISPVSSSTAVNTISKSSLPTVAVTSPVSSSNYADITSTELISVVSPSPLLTPKKINVAQFSYADTTSPIYDWEMEEKLRSFINIDRNEYLTGRSKSKEIKRMLCDCSLTKEEIQRGEKGCGEDCLNRLLMIECGARCVLRENCTNRRFQNLEYANCEIFRTKRKGYGLRSLEYIPTGGFILEYVGEVLDPKEFRKRAKDYAKDKNLHYYFMALKSDSIIDATIKGNDSRFINHSCDPNAETQKWTVNGELRIGFFSKRPIAAGEEITFDYQLQRYGKEAQRCYCESSSCRGWIGEDPIKEGKWSDGGSRKERKEKKKKIREIKDILNDMDLEEEIEKLEVSGLKNRAHTLTLCRLMVRAEEEDSRRRLLKLLRRGDTACLRLFLDYHGLRLVWSWMMESEFNLKIEILEALSKLPIPNKTMLQDSKVLSVVEKWANADRNISLKAKLERTQSNDDESVIGASNKVSNEIITDSNSSRTTDLVDSTSQKDIMGTDSENVTQLNKYSILASELLADWSSLKEVFRIPKKERIEQMKEHEREADRGYKERYRDRRDWFRRDRYSSDYDRRDRYRDRDRHRDRDRKRSRGSPEKDHPSKRVNDNDSADPKLSKIERRQLFMQKVEEEDRQKKEQEEMWQQHQDQCQALGIDPSNTAAFDPQTGYPCFFDPNTQTWQPYSNDSNISNQNVDPSGFPPQPLIGGPPGIFNPNQQPPIPFHGQPQPFIDTSQPPPTFVDTTQPPPFIDTSQPPPFMDPNQNTFPPTGPMFPMHPPAFPIPDASAPFPPQQFGPNPFQGPPPQFCQPNTFPPDNPQPTQFQPVPFDQSSQNFNNVQQFQTNLPSPVVQPYPAIALPQAAVDPNAQLPVSQENKNDKGPLQPENTTKVEELKNIVPLLVGAPPPPPPRLPPKWKSAKDKEGRTYYYHVKTRISQWEPPVWDQTTQNESDSSSDSDDDSDDDSSSSSTSDEEEEEKNEALVETETVDTQQDYEDPFSIENEINMEKDDEMELFNIDNSLHESIAAKRKRDGLVQERIISPRTDFELERTDKKKYRDVKEKLKKQKAKFKEKIRLHEKKAHRQSKLKTSSKCEADTSGDPARKIKENFRSNMAGVIVHYLNPYRKSDCKIGRITNTDDFKHLARKLTHFVMVKELKHCKNIDELNCNDNVKYKARDFIRKYMAKYGSIYQRTSDDD